jgi:hypothetical protein
VAVKYLPAAAGTSNGVVTVSNSSGVAGSIVIALSGTATAAPTGSIASTENPLVAEYTVTPKSAANVTVEFGTDTTYGFTTSSAASSGSAVSLLVGGMRADTTYHMRAIIAYADGATVTNEDETFKTGSLPASLAALNLTATTVAGMSPQPGIELVDPVNSGPYQPYAVDLQGNVVWYYPWTDHQSSLLLDGIKQLTNGNYIAVIGVPASQPLTSAADPSSVMIREFDLAGKTVKQLTLAQLNSSLASAGYSLVLADFHDDITVLPNGHWLVLANTLKSVNGTNVLGDAVVDVDSELNPKFVWNEFDYFDTSRQPMMYPDWTHSNAVVYSPGDGNFLVSIPHQNWVVKVNYKNGTGDGSVLWKLGYQGDFTLENGTGSIDWQYAQHYPSFVGTATSGVFNLVLMDNGNDRIVSGIDGVCGSNGNEACYTTVPNFQINETAMTANIESRITLPASLYSDSAGNAEVLDNNDLEYNLSGVATGSVIQEVLPDADHTLVWSLVANGNSEYRAFRLPSLYPNVQWPLPSKVNGPISPRESKGKF